jgi:hypothetical protein
VRFFGSPWGRFGLPLGFKDPKRTALRKGELIQEVAKGRFCAVGNRTVGG